MSSTNNYFTSQTNEELLEKRKELIQLLKKRFSMNYISGILEAYDYFIEHKTDFDGATIVPDLYDFYNIEISALVHDYIYLKFNVASHLSSKRKADNLYKQMLINFTPLENDYERIKIAKRREKGLWVSSYLYWLFNQIKNGRMTKQQRIEFNNYIKKFD